MRLKIALAAAGVAVAAFSVAPAALAGSPVADVTPTPTAPGTSTTFAVFCGTSADSAALFGTTLGLPEQVPMQPSTHSGEFVATVTIPTSTSPGTYRPSIDCSNGVSTTATVTVSALPGQAPQTGDGTTSTTTNGTLTDIGIGVLAFSVLLGGGILASRRRQRNKA